MISVKTGTQTFSQAPQTSSLKSSNVDTISASDKEKYFEGKDLGEVLNKVADPNWVDPSKVARKVGSNELGKEDFLKLLLTQLKNQDPTSPMESHQMAAQLAQFSSLEQLSNINSSIDGLATAQKPAQQFDTLKMIGKSVQGDSSKIYRGDLAAIHDISFTLGQDVESAKMKVKDELGNVVREFDAQGLKKGKNSFTWDGVVDNGSKARPGHYTIEIDSRGKNGNKVHAETKFNGLVTGVNFSPAGPILMMGNQSVKLSDIKSIVDPVTLKASAKEEEGNKVKVSDSKEKSNSVNATVSGGNLDSIAMDRGMMNKMKKKGLNPGI